MIARTADNLAFAVLLVILAASPLPLGANFPSVWSGITITILLALGVVGLALLADRERRIVLPPAILAAAVLFLGVCGWIFVQTLPDLQPAWWHPAWGLALDDLSTRPTPSLDPLVGREALARLAGYAGMLALAFLVGQQRQRAERLLLIILAIITAYAIFGLLRQLMGWKELFGIRLAYGNRAAGSFGNPNIFAAYVNLGSAIALCLLMWNRRDEADSPRLLTSLSRLLTSLLEKHSLLVLALGINLLACIVSASRAGIASLGLTAILVLLISLRGSRWPLFAVAAVLAVFMGWGMLNAGGETLLARLNTMMLGGELDSSGSMRVDGWSLAIAQLRERPWLGQGYGTFFEAFHLARDARFVPVVFDYLHSTWLELAVELGLPAAACLMLSLALLLGSCIAAMRRGVGSVLPLAGIAASAALGLHGLVDFPGQIPALALTWAAITGLACGRAGIARSSARRSTKNI